MLTKDLLRFKVDGDRLVPLLLTGSPAQRELAAALLAHWQGGVGRRRGDLEDAATPILHRSRALLIAKGLHKLIVDGCRFADPASTEHLRSEALALSAAALTRPAADARAHRAAIAQHLGSDAEALAERLYGDLPDAAVLEAAPDTGVEALIAHYNLALCQGLLLHARRLDIAVADADTGLRRRLLAALRFRRLLAEVRADGGGVLRLAVSGPGAVLDQSSRYGLQLALFLPALACCRRWTASADIAVPRLAGRGLGGPGTARLDLAQDLGLPGDNAALGHVPAEVRELAAAIAAKQPDWQVADAQLLPLPSGELVVPDLHLVVDGAVIAVELFHRWHASALRRRLDQFAQGLLPRLVIGVDRALVRSPGDAPLAALPAFVRHGFVFTDIPTPRALVQAVERVRAG